MASPNRPSVRFRRIGKALRKAREDAGMTLESASRKFGRSPGWLSMVENGLQHVRLDDLTYLLDFYRVTNTPLRDSLLYLADQVRRKSWTRTYEGRVSAAALDLASLEEDSAEIRTFQPHLAPGLTQTEEYARRVMAAGQPGAMRDTAELVAFRMARQHVLTSQPCPTYRVIIGESALHQQVGGPGVMRAQLARMIVMARHEHMAIHVLPYSAGAHLWVAVPFHILTLRPPGRLTVAVVDLVTRSEFVEDERETETYEGFFDHLLSAALDESLSLEVIQRILSKT